MDENWRDIEGFEGYQVSESGLVRSCWKHNGAYSWLPNGEWNLLSLVVGRRGYAKVSLTSETGQKNREVHRLVAIAFIPNPGLLPQVNHKDGNKSNNHISNLEWATASENVRHALLTGLRVPLVGPANPLYGRPSPNRGKPSPRRGMTGSLDPKSKPVEGVDPATGVTLVTFDSAHDAGRAGYNQGAVSACCRGERAQYKGLVWRRAA